MPPLRPVPASAENVVVEQLGDRIRLRWTSPVRNTDGTTEKIDLREARVLRRVVDLEALVEEQTVVPEPEPEAESAQRAEETGETTETEGTTEEVEAPEGAGEEDTEQQAQEEGEPVATGMEEEDASEAEPPPAPERPTLQIPPFGGEVVTTVDARELGEAFFYEEEIEPSWIGKRVQYAVVYENGKGRESPLSAVAQIDPREALEPPAEITAEAGDGLVLVEWSPPGALESPDEELGFAVYRREAGDGAEYPETPLGGGPVREPRFEDRTAVFGNPVCYAVTSLVLPPLPEVEEEETEEATPEETVEEASPEESEGEAEPEPVIPIVPPIPGPPRVESEPSEETCLTPEDRFPPPAPSDLVAVPAPEGVLLTWREAEAPDLAGYRVYRSERPDRDFQLLAEVTRGSYRDEEAEPERTYYYGITAIDDAPSVNESGRTNVVEARRPSPR